MANSHFIPFDITPSPISTMPSAPDVEIVLADDHARDSGSSLSDGEDMFLTINTLGGADFPAIERPRALVKTESLLSEKQISVDPISLMGPTIRQASFKLVSTPPRNPKVLGDGLDPPLPPPKLKFVSASLPGSAPSSPGSCSSSKKKMSQRSSMDDADLALQESMRRSRSEGQGRSSASADDFDIMLERPTMKYNHSQSSSFSKSGVGYDDRQPKDGKQRGVPEDGFNCGKLCLFLPRGKGKAVRASSSSSISSMSSRISRPPSNKAGSMTSASSYKSAKISPAPSRKSEEVPRATSHKSEQISPAPSRKSGRMLPVHPLKMDPPMISKRVSLERFDFGSFSSSISDYDAAEPANLFFDLPLEMIRYSVSDVQSPVTAAFLFNKDAKQEDEPKGVLENASSSSDIRKSVSHDSSRQVRFSTSSPTSFPSSPTSGSPRQKAREDFSIFLDAQSS